MIDHTIFEALCAPVEPVETEYSLTAAEVAEAYLEAPDAFPLASLLPQDPEDEWPMSPGTATLGHDRMAKIIARAFAGLAINLEPFGAL